MGPILASAFASPVAAGTYPRFRFQGALPPVYDKGVGIDVQTDEETSNLVSFLASAAYLAARGNPLGYDFTMPDVAGLAGFPVESRLSAGANSVVTSGFGFTGTGIFDLRPALGAAFKGGVKVGALTVP
jgi:hypothetical protein